MRLMMVLLALLLNFSVGHGAPQAVEEDLSRNKIKLFSDEHARELDRFLAQAMMELQIPGAAMAVVQNGKIVYRQGLGLKKIGSPEPVTPKTAFMIGSATKPLTTLMLAKLVDLGRVSWETPLLKILPEFALADKDLTAKILLKHTACACTGVPRSDTGFFFGRVTDSLETTLRQMMMIKPVSGFGEVFHYNSQLVAVGGMAGAQVYNKGSDAFHRYENAMHDLVFEPLGMKDTRVRPQESDLGQLAAPHAEGFKGGVAVLPQSVEDFVYAIAPAGSIWSNVDDMAQYLLMELKEGKTASGKTYISSPQLLTRRIANAKVSDKISYGIGLFIEDAQGVPLVAHSGMTIGFTSGMFFLPRHDLGVILLSNAGGANDFKNAVRQKVFELMLGAKERSQDMIQVSRKNLQDGVRERTRLISLEAQDVTWINGYVGDYENSGIGRMSIRKDGQAYYVKTDRWESQLGSVKADGQEQTMAFVSPPWSGTLGLSVKRGSPRTLMFEDEVPFIEVK